MWFMWAFAATIGALAVTSSAGEQVSVAPAGTELGWQCKGAVAGDFTRRYSVLPDGRYVLEDSATQTTTVGPAWSAVVDVADERKWPHGIQTDVNSRGSLDGVRDLKVGSTFEAWYLRTMPNQPSVEMKHTVTVVESRDVDTVFAGKQKVFVVTDEVSGGGFTSLRTVHYAPALKYNVSGSFTNNAGVTVECVATKASGPKA